MKKCYKCEKDKELECFSKNKAKPDGLSSQCKDCHKKLRRAHYENNQQEVIQQVKRKKRKYHAWFISLKDKPCTDCGKSYPHYVMDFDHLRDKEFGLSTTLNYNWGRERVLSEIAKCELVCANCHRERTHQRQALLA